VVAVPSIGRASQVTPRRAAPEADATRDLYERYARQIYAYCHHQLGNREEAEDAMQSTFLNAFRGFKRGVDPEFESAWLYKIAQNVCLTRQRSSSRRRRVESPGDLDAIQDILPSHEVDSDELIGLPEALQGLPKQQQRALLLREWQGLSYKEIADELGLTQAAVETLLFRARRSLAAGLSDEPAKGKSIVSKLRVGTDAGSLFALLQSFLSFGGAKVAATVATVAATSVVASTPTARHAVEHAVVPATPHHVAPAAQVTKPHATHSFVASTAPAPVAHTSDATTTQLASRTVTQHGRLSFASAQHPSLPVSHRPRVNATPDATVHPVTPAAPAVENTQPAPVPTPAPTPAPAGPVVDLPPAAVAVALPPAPTEKAKDAKSNGRDAIPASPVPSKRDEKSNGKDAKSDHGDKHADQHSRRETLAVAPTVTPAAPTAPTAPAAPAAPAATSAAPTWQPPGNAEKQDAREARKAKGQGKGQDAQPSQPAAPATAVPAPTASVAPAVAAPAPPAATTPAPAPADDSRDRGARGQGHRK
jgi:RNA polymerase sigma-70 factor (ECF subfamily)